MALTPNQLQAIPENIIELYQQLEDFIIDDISRRIAKVGSITDTSEWQSIRAQEIGISLDTIMEEVARVNKLSDAEIERIFKEAANISVKADNTIYNKANLGTLSISESQQLRTHLLAAIKQTKSDLRNFTQSLGFVTRGPNGKIIANKLMEFYQNTLDFAQLQISSGVTDYNTAIRQAVKRLSQSGVRVVSYESGWHNRVDVAVRRATLTGANQMAKQMTDYMHNELVNEEDQYVEVTAHSGARESHARWQGKVFKVIGSAKGYPNLEEETGLGTGAGLMGWNCRHSYFPFIPGASSPAYSENYLKNIDPPDFQYNGRNYTYYEATQEQRKFETEIRAIKRELIGYNAVGDKEAFTSASIKLNQYKRAYKEFSNAAGIRQKKERHQVIEYGKSVSQKSVWANKKASK